MSMLQKMQEDTARLHEQFLAGQTEALCTMRTLMGTQSAPGMAVPAPQGVPTQERAPANVPAVESATQRPVAAEAPAAATIPAQPAKSAPAAPAQPGIDVAAELLRIVADKTGYPADMLELDMSLDADLGIDSIKRVEILSALQEQLPDLPSVEPQQLSALQTLRQIVDTLGTAVAQSTPAPAAPSGAPAQADIDVAAELLRIVADKTGYPADMLELDMSLDADLGIDSIKRVEILSALQEQLPDLPSVEPQQLSALQTLRQIVDTLGTAVAQSTPAPAAPSGAPAQADIDVAAELLRIVADKTGYPADMLELDMSLDADLGIDSIKRVEILSALQEQLPDLPSVEPQQLSALQTLRQIVDTLGTAVAQSIPALAAPSGAPAQADIDVAAELLRIVADKTGYPADMLELDMSLDADLGIDSIKRVEILSALQEQLPDLPSVEPQQLSALQTLRQIVDTLVLETSAQVSESAGTQEPQGSAEKAESKAEAIIHRQVLRLAPVQRERRELNLKAPLWVVEDGSTLARDLVAALTNVGLNAKVVSPGGNRYPEAPRRPDHPRPADGNRQLLHPRRIRAPATLWLCPARCSH